jgi:hypothetical protein
VPDFGEFADDGPIIDNRSRMNKGFHVDLKWLVHGLSTFPFRCMDDPLSLSKSERREMLAIKTTRKAGDCSSVGLRSDPPTTRPQSKQETRITGSPCWRWILAVTRPMTPTPIAG